MAASHYLVAPEVDATVPRRAATAPCLLGAGSSPPAVGGEKGGSLPSFQWLPRRASAPAVVARAPRPAVVSLGHAPGRAQQPAVAAMGSSAAATAKQRKKSGKARLAQLAPFLLLGVAVAAANILSTEQCEDHNQMCPEWARRGECMSNPGFMLQACGASCRSCSVSAVRMHRQLVMVAE